MQVGPGVSVTCNGDPSMTSKRPSGSGRALRIGVVGAGVMGTNHARVLAGLPDVALVGIVDPLPAHRTRATELIGCRTFTGLEELFAQGVDAVTIARADASPP